MEGGPTGLEGQRAPKSPTQKPTPKTTGHNTPQEDHQKLIVKGLAAWYPSRKGRTVTITPEGKRLASQHCIEDWDKIRRGEA